MPPPYRFAVGDRVTANTGSEPWPLGRIIALDYSEHGSGIVPYQIELDNGTRIMAPMDDDMSVRRAPSLAASSGSGGGGIAVGSNVVLHNLSATSMNGRRGRVTAFDEETGRWVVEVKNKGTKKQLKIKAENLFVLKSTRKAELRKLARVAEEERRRDDLKRRAVLSEDLTARHLEDCSTDVLVPPAMTRGRSSSSPMKLSFVHGDALHGLRREGAVATMVTVLQHLHRLSAVKSDRLQERRTERAKLDIDRTRDEICRLAEEDVSKDEDLYAAVEKLRQSFAVARSRGALAGALALCRDRRMWALQGGLDAKGASDFVYELVSGLRFACREGFFREEGAFLNDDEAFHIVAISQIATFADWEFAYDFVDAVIQVAGGPPVFRVLVAALAEPVAGRGKLAGRLSYAMVGEGALSRGAGWTGDFSWVTAELVTEACGAFKGVLDDERSSEETNDE